MGSALLIVMAGPYGGSAELLGLSDPSLGRLWAVDHRKPSDTSGHYGLVNPQAITGYASSSEVTFPSVISLLRQRFGVRVPGGAPPRIQWSGPVYRRAFYVHRRRLGGTFGAHSGRGWTDHRCRGVDRRAAVRRSLECDGGLVDAAVEPERPEAASASPKKSSNSTLSGTPWLSWVNTWLPVPVSPPADTGRTLIAPHP
jgi:hypothetical protein